MQLIGRKHRAGRHADDWFKAGLAAWRRRARAWFVLAMLPLFVLLAAAAAIWPSWLQFYAGLLVGAAGAAYVCLLDSPPEWIERKRRGRDGERRTERALRPLERHGRTVVHDVPAPRGNLDHVVVGPSGAYLLETKCLQGRVSFDGGMVVRRGDDERDSWRPYVPLDRTMRGSAAELQRRLKSAGVRWVERVVVLWSDFADGELVIDGTTYVHGSRLAGWLLERPSRLSHDALEKAGNLARELDSVPLGHRGSRPAVANRGDATQDRQRAA